MMKLSPGTAGLGSRLRDVLARFFSFHSGASTEACPASGVPHPLHRTPVRSRLGSAPLQSITPLLLTITTLALSHPSPAQTYDLIIRNARVIDGTGNPWFRASIAVNDGKIAAIGIIPPTAKARREIDAQDHYVTPGFIDVHTHCEDDLLTHPAAENFIRMGVTTVITGNCGGSYLNLAEAFTSHTRQGIGINMASLFGHNTVRRKVMGNANRDPSTTEIAAMREFVGKAMRDGAVGLSTGLIYTPGLYSKTPEIVELAKEAAKYKGVYASHMRNEGSRVAEAINEALTIGRESGMPVEISHFKITWPKSFGQSTMTLQMVEDARKAGQDVTVDEYVYTASSTGLGTSLPDWASEGDTTAVRNRLKDPETREKIIAEMIHDKRDVAGRPDMSYANIATAKGDKTLDGLTILEAAKKLRHDDSWRAQIETMLDIITSGGASMVYHSMEEGDVSRIAAYPNTMFASDSGVREFNSGVPHPRGYGNNARVLAHYVRDQKLLRLEDAIRKMTSLPARSFRFFDRGVLRPGAAADIVIFDIDKVEAPSTFEKPHAYAEGFEYVFVNGQPVIDNGQLTGKRTGQIIYGPGKTSTPTKRTRKK